MGGQSAECEAGLPDQRVTVNDFKIPDPPANSSDQTRAEELNYLLSLQYSRTLEDITTSIYMSDNPESPSDIGRLIGYWTDPQKLPLTDSLMDKVERDGDYFLWSLKFKYARVRPYIIEPKIHDLEESRASSLSKRACYLRLYQGFYLPGTGARVYRLFYCKGLRNVKGSTDHRGALPRAIAKARAYSHASLSTCFWQMKNSGRTLKKLSKSGQRKGREI